MNLKVFEGAVMAVYFDEDNQLLILIVIYFVPYFIYRTTQKSVNWLIN
jgi:hypothetical protein